MLRSVDGWDSEHFSFGAAHAPTAAGPTEAATSAPTTIAIDDSSDGPSATIPDSHLLFTAQFSRAGADLVLTGEDGKAFVVHDYFATDVRARLLSAEGAALSPDVVAALAGPLAPGQYAQAGAVQPAVKAVGRVVQADGDATIVRNGVAMAAHAGDAILKGDVLQTVTGTFGVTFNDGSTLNLTANSRLVVNEFVYDPQGQANSQLLDLVQGSLTFISGEVAHNGDMKIGTPVATMAIRGTVGGVTTANDGTVNFYVSQSATGAVILDSRGTVIANVVQDGPLILVRPVGPLQVLAEEIQKSPAQLATELSALQQIVSIQSVGQQIIQQFFQQDPNATPNPKSTDTPHTQIQIEIPAAPTPSSNDSHSGDNNTPPPTATVTVITPPTTPGGQPTIQHETITIPANLAPINFGPLTATATAGQALTFTGQNAISVFDADTANLTVKLSADHGLLTLHGTNGLTFIAGNGGVVSDGVSDAEMIFSGTQAAINTALDGMTYTPAANYSGAAQVSITTSDGNSTTAPEVIAVTVNHGNTAPEVHASHVSVSEEGLPSGIPDTIGTHDTTNSATATGTICATDADGDHLTFSLGEPTAVLRSGGQTIIWSLDQYGTLHGVVGVVGDERTIITVSINGDGEYTVSLLGPIDHANPHAEDVKNLCIPVNVSDGTDTTTTTLTVKIEDDSPKAVAFYETAVAGVPVSTVNLVLILDVSGSMNTSVSGDETRLSLAKNALHNLLSTENVQINQVMAVAFSGSANVHTVSTSPWTSASSAETFIQSLSSSGGTNYDGALSGVYNAWGTGPTPADKTVVYFISDGEPTSGQSLDSTDTATWQNFLAAKHVDISYAIGITTTVSNAQLNDIAWTPSDSDFSPILLSSATGLNATLQGTVPEAASHNIFTDGDSHPGFGADGGRIYSVAVDGITYTWDGAVHITKSGDESNPLDGNSISVTTELGGTFKFAFGDGNGHLAGDWSYTPPDSLNGLANEVFHYVLSDYDADHAEADITVTVEGTQIKWTSAIGDDWYSANWSSETVPSSGSEDVSITMPVGQTVYDNGSASVKSLVVGHDVTLSVGGGLEVQGLTLNDGNITADHGVVGFGGDVISHGSLIARNTGSMGFAATLVGTVMLDGGGVFFDGNVTAEATVNFVAPLSAVQLFNPSSFAGHITNFQPGDAIDFGILPPNDLSLVSYQVGDHSVTVTYAPPCGCDTNVTIGTDQNYTSQDFAVVTGISGGYSLVFNQTWIGGEGNGDPNDGSNWSLGQGASSFIAATVDDGATHDADLGNANLELAGLFVGADTELDFSNGTLAVSYLHNTGSVSIENGELDVWSPVTNPAGATIEALADGMVHFANSVDGSGAFKISGGAMEFDGAVDSSVTVTFNTDTFDSLIFGAAAHVNQPALADFGSGDSIEFANGIDDGSFFFQDYGSLGLLHVSVAGASTYMWLSGGGYSSDNFSISSDEGGDTFINFVPTVSWAAPTGDNNIALELNHVGADAISVDWGDGSDPSTGETSFSHSYDQAAPTDLAIKVDDTIVASYNVVVGSAPQEGEQTVYVTGTSGNDVLIGNNGAAENVYGGQGGNDVMFASAAADTFVFASGSGHDTVVGFDSTHDVIDISGFVQDNQLQAFLDAGVDNGHGLLFTEGGDSLFLQDVHSIALANLQGFVPS